MFRELMFINGVSSLYLVDVSKLAAFLSQIHPKRFIIAPSLFHHFFD